MISLLSAKLSTYRSFLKFLALHLLGIIAASYAASHLTTVSFQNTSLPLGDLFGRPEAWQTICSITHWFFYIPAFFMVQLVCAELELKLVRAQVIAGLERIDIVRGWITLNALLVLGAMLATAVSVLLFSHQSAGGGSLSIIWLSELGYGIYGLGLLNWSVFAAVMMRRPVPALALLTVWSFLAEPVLSFALGRQGWDAASPYLPFATLSQLTPLPGFGAVFDPLAPTTFAAIGYAILAPALTWIRLRQADL